MNKLGNGKTRRDKRISGMKGRGRLGANLIQVMKAKELFVTANTIYLKKKKKRPVVEQLN